MGHGGGTLAPPERCPDCGRKFTSHFPFIGRFPFWRVIEEWIAQRAKDPRMDVPVLADGQITLERLTQAARVCEAEAPGETMTPLEFVEWVSYLVEGHQPGIPVQPDLQHGRQGHPPHHRMLAGYPGRKHDLALAV